MKPLLIALLAGSMSLSAGAALAKNNGNGHGNGNGKQGHNAPATQPVQQQAAGCPPGLAKKNPPCIPPGQAKKYNPGQHINNYVYIQNPDHPDHEHPAVVYAFHNATQEVPNLPA